MNNPQKGRPKIAAPRIHHAFRIPAETLEIIKRVAEEKKISQSDVLTLWAQAWSTNVLMVKPKKELQESYEPQANVRISETVAPDLPQPTTVPSGSLMRMESHPVLRPSELKAKK